MGCEQVDVLAGGEERIGEVGCGKSSMASYSSNSKSEKSSLEPSMIGSLGSSQSMSSSSSASKASNTLSVEKSLLVILVCF